MARKLELWYATKPYIETQGWGIFNPAYQQFGFSRHNGRDFKLGADSKLYSPQRYQLKDKGFSSTGAGIYVVLVSVEQWNIEGKDCWDECTFMHLKEGSPVSIGTILEIGDFIGVADNTGFSTGPHTHERHRRVDAGGNPIDQNDANGSYDHAPYFFGYPAQDSQKLLTQIQSILSSLASKVANLIKKPQ